MSKFEKIKKGWNIIVSEWKTRYRLVFSNEETHEQSLVIRKITIQKIVVYYLYDLLDYYCDWLYC